MNNLAKFTRLTNSKHLGLFWANKYLMTEQPTNSGTNKKFTLTVIAAVAILIILASSLIIFNTQRNNQDNQKSSPGSSQNSSSESMQAKAISKLSGKYTGPITILTDFLIFPKAEFSIAPAETFTLKAEGLDLALLNNPKLAVGEKYPTAQVTATGITKQAELGKIEISIENIKVDFLIDNQPLPEAQSQPILTALGAFGIVIPTASKETPVVGRATYIEAGNKITITNSSDSSIKLRMEGVRN